MPGHCVGYIAYTRCTNTRDFIEKKLIAAGCKKIVTQHYPYDSHALKSCLQELSKGDVLITWRLDKTIPKYQNKVLWVADILERGISILSLADRLTLSGELNHPGGRLCNYLKVWRTLPYSKRLVCGRYHRLNPEQTESIYHAINNKQSTISVQARKYSVSRTTLYAAMKRYAKENNLDE